MSKKANAKKTLEGLVDKNDNYLIKKIDLAPCDEVGSNIRISSVPTSVDQIGYETLKDNEIKDWEKILTEFNAKDEKSKKNTEGVNWCGTWNNPDVKPEIFGEYLQSLQFIDYYIYQLEKGELGTTHIQYYIHLNVKKRWSYLMTCFMNGLNAVPYLAPMYAKSSPRACFNYCTKGKTRIEGPFEYGNLPDHQGTRNDFKNMAINIRTNGLTQEIKDTAIYAKHQKWCDQRNQERMNENYRIYAEKLFLDKPLTELQLKIEKYILTQDNRKILWIADTIGSCGKSHLSEWFYYKHNAYLMVNALNKDVFEAYDNEDIVIIDLPRTEESTLNTTAIELFKNGVINKSKYNSKVYKRTPVIVVVFSNTQPNKKTLSADRWDVISIDEDSMSDKIIVSLDKAEKINRWNKKCTYVNF